ncbi:MAG: tRNA pseudouridine(55) synthase TruB [Chloroflexota bacterium]|nr:tRNA pseudouridine(55) synthase TruB [Chloroflexota bacterium]
MTDEPVFGFLNVDKPLGMTSHDVVARVRRTFGVRKVGHAGTLDPLATGVLVICIGGATRLSEYVMHATKRYTAQVYFGVTTSTYDAEGEAVQTRDASHLNRDMITEALNRFVGDIQQVPPIYSAIKVGGRKLYDIARAGETVELEARSVTIERIDLLNWQPPVATIDVTCNAGTYIRSLAYDMGEALGTGAHLASLRRTQSGTFLIADAAEPEVIFSDALWRERLVPAHVALAGWRHVMLDEAQSDIMAHGGSVAHEDAPEGELALAYAPGFRLLAVVRGESGLWVPQKVFWRG